MFTRLARAVTARPWWVIGGWLVAVAILVALAPRLDSVTTADQASFLPDSAESARAAALAKTAFPQVQGATGVIVVKRGDGGTLESGQIATIGGLAQHLNQTRPDAVLGLQFDPATGVARNGAVALIGVQFSGAPEQAQVRQAVALLRSDVAQGLRDTGLTAGMTGQAPIVVDNKDAMGSAEKIVAVATLALIVLLLLVVFRSPIAAALPLVTVGLVYGATSALVALAAHGLDVKVGQELPVMLTVVLFGIGTDYILFLLFRYRERLRAGDAPRAAIVGAVERVGEAISSAAFAVIAAFSALALATLGFFTTLGPALAIGAVAMLLAALTLVPAVVTVLGRWVFWPARPRRIPVPPRGPMTWLGRLVARRPGAIVAGCLALLAGLSVAVLTVHADYDPIGQLPPRTEAAAAFTDLSRGFPAGAVQPTQVYLHADRPLGPADLEAFIGRLSHVNGVVTAMQPSMSADGRTAQVPLVLAGTPYSDSALNLVSGPLRQDARAAAPAGMSVVVGGQTMALADIRSATDRDLRLIFPVAAALFVLILALLLRALLAPAYLVAMVVAGFAATLGGSALLFQHALGHAGLTFSLPIVLYLFVTAIGTDYNILMTARLREEIRDGRGPREAAALAIQRTGGSVVAAAVILAGTFAALLLSGVPFFVQIGFAVTLGILIVAFVVALLLVPATTALLGRAAWWPGTRHTPPELDELVGVTPSGEARRRP
jgi:putative drug exporter of the RND superfamily